MPSANFVKVPRDITQAYYFRASRAAMLVPEASRMEWLEQRDLADRSAWVSKFREGEETLGQVVQSVMLGRGAHWDPPMHHTFGRPGHTAQHHQPAQRQQQSAGRKGDRKGNSGQPPSSAPRKSPSGSPAAKTSTGSTASTMRDGTLLCQDFNRGSCNVKAAACSKGAHKCNKILRSGTPCGMRFHGAHKCRNT